MLKIAKNKKICDLYRYYNYNNIYEGCFCTKKILQTLWGEEKGQKNLR